MGGTIKIKEPVTLGHQPNLGEEIEDVEFAAGDELTVLQEFEGFYLAKDGDGKLFNVKKDLAESTE